jgi:hypothetical protein
LITENIYTLKHGFGENTITLREKAYKDSLLKLVLRRQKQISIMDELHKREINRRNELSNWVAHSKKFTFEMVVRVCEDIVKLLH